MTPSAPLVPGCLVLGLAWSCNAAWGIGDLAYDDTPGPDGGMGGASSSGGQGGTAASGGAGGAGASSGAGGAEAVCVQACNDLFDCGLQDGNCPGFSEAGRQPFVEGCHGKDGCLAQCLEMPALRAIIDTDDCAGTIAALSGASPDFGDTCQNGPDCGAGGTGGGGGR